MGVVFLVRITILAISGQETVAKISDKVSLYSGSYDPSPLEFYSSHDTSVRSSTDTTVDQTLLKKAPLALNSSATPNTSLFTKPPSPVLTEGCDDLFCHKELGHFVVNATACVEGPTYTLYIWGDTTIDIVSNMTWRHTDVKCLWKMVVIWTQYITVTIDKLVTDYDKGDGNFTLEFINDMHKHAFNETTLRNNSATFPFSRPFTVVFRSHAPHRVLVISIHIFLHTDILVYALPVVPLSDSVSYVTTPVTKRNQHSYPPHYDGVFHLNLTVTNSVFISFTYFILKEDEKCEYDYVKFTAPMQNKTWTKCGKQNLPLQIFRSSLELHFHSDKEHETTGFKMMFAILLRSQEPQQLSVHLLNCSVPHFHIFQPLLNCNLESECQDGEDEQDCDYDSDDCHHGDIDAGTKCYKLFRPKQMTWMNAEYECTKNGSRLMILATVDEYKMFVKILSIMRNVHLVYIGARIVPRLQKLSVASAAIYRKVWQWLDERTAFVVNGDGYGYDFTCAVYRSDLDVSLIPARCHDENEADFFCEYEKANVATSNTQISNTTQTHISIYLKEQTWNVSMVQCPEGHVTREFLPCNFQELCSTNELMTSCQMKDSVLPMFLCQGSNSALHYTLVCDLVQHCPDMSDENFCVYPPCPSTTLQCWNGQCISSNQFCDNRTNCFDGSDELECPATNGNLYLSESVIPPAILYTDERGLPRFRKMLESEKCPKTHFQCPGGYCLPIFLLCNGILDCPGREDEAECDSYVCPGLYRCQGTKVCLHSDSVCDGVFHCPQYDDEMLCEESCPDVCHCQGLAFACTSHFSASSYTELRYLDISGTGMNPGDLIHYVYLIHLRLSKCRIKVLPTLRLPNLIHIDLSWNNLESIDIHHFQMLENLQVLVLSGNPLTLITNRASPDAKLMKLLKIDISHTGVKVYNGSTLAKYRKIKALNISASELTTITEEGFQSTLMLETLDVRGSPLQNFPRDLLKHLIFLKVVYADNYILCCKAVLPEDFDPKNCQAEQELLASCEDLLKSNAYRVFLWLFALMSIVGNLGSFVGRLYLHTDGSRVSSFSVFVTSLSVADFVMGVYLAMIGVADLVFHGEYLWNNDHWKNSVVCSIAGFLSVLSNEVSAFLICLITLDRFLVLQFPFSTVHFNRWSALVACGTVWTVGTVLAAIPLLPMTSFWEFYSQTSICIPLPFMNKETFLGYAYSFIVMIVVNFILFVLIAVGQAIVYFSIRSNTVKMTASKDATIARRLTTIAVSDFLCWFPVGLLGMLASTGTAVPGELNVAVVIFVLPLNSALNPFLYTINVFMEKRLKAREATIMKRLESHVNMLHTCTDTAPVNKTLALHQIKMWLDEQILTLEDIILDSQKMS